MYIKDSWKSDKDWRQFFVDYVGEVKNYRK